MDPEQTREARLEQIAEDLCTGRKVADPAFDQVYPPGIRKLSIPHWTPVEVAIRVAELLVVDDSTRVLDVGSGCGKFCLVGALSSRGTFVGVEQRPNLVEVARRAAEELHADQASFIHGNMTALDWSSFDSFYFFNPFYENQDKQIRMDDTISHNLAKFSRYVETVRQKLEGARPGTRVATYHGFGGEMPSSYTTLLKERIGTHYIELWVKSPKCDKENES